MKTSGFYAAKLVYFVLLLTPVCKTQYIEPYFRQSFNSEVQNPFTLLKLRLYQGDWNSLQSTVSRLGRELNDLKLAFNRNLFDYENIHKTLNDYSAQIQDLKVSYNKNLQDLKDELANKANIQQLNALAAKLDARTSDIVDIGKIPTSCLDQKNIGNKMNGLFLVKGPTYVETVYCDFTKQTSDTGFETKIGYVDVKSSPVYFYVQRDSSFTTQKVPITFTIERLNIGGAMDVASGIFTAPRSGVYYFSFFGTVDGDWQHIILYKNGAQIGSGYNNGYRDTLAIQSTLRLSKGDKVWVALNVGSPLFDDSSLYTHFVGYLLEEDRIFE